MGQGCFQGLLHSKSLPDTKPIVAPLAIAHTPAVASEAVPAVEAKDTTSSVAKKKDGLKKGFLLSGKEPAADRTPAASKPALAADAKPVAVAKTQPPETVAAPGIAPKTTTAAPEAAKTSTNAPPASSAASEPAKASNAAAPAPTAIKTPAVPEVSKTVLPPSAESSKPSPPIAAIDPVPRAPTTPTASVATPAAVVPVMKKSTEVTPKQTKEVHTVPPPAPKAANAEPAMKPKEVMPKETEQVPTVPPRVPTSSTAVVPAPKPSFAQDEGEWREIGSTYETDIAQWQDVSVDQNGSIQKVIITASTLKPGVDEGVTPTDGARLELEFAWRVLEGSQREHPEPMERWDFRSEPKKISIALGNCEVCDALEYALISMKRGETCVVRCGANGRGKASTWTDVFLGLKPQSCGGALPAVDMLITLLNCEKEKDVMEMEAAERIQYATERKDCAAKYFKAQRYAAAYYKYKLVADCLDYTDDLKGEDADKVSGAKAMRKASKLNEAACGLKLEDWRGVIKVCDDILKDDADNEKALYRRAVAYLKQGDFGPAEFDLKRCAEKYPENNEAKTLLKQCKAEAKTEGAAQKERYAKMLKGAGRLKAPPGMQWQSSAPVQK